MSKKHTILYVDDEPVNLMLFEVSFQDNFTVITAESGTEGLKFLDQNPEIAVVFSDMKMPGMNGLEFIRTAKSKYSDICYSILTGFDITDEISGAIKEKLIVKCFGKPFQLDEILTTINSCLGIN